MFNATFDLTISLIFQSNDEIENISTILGVSPTLYRSKKQSKFDFIEFDKNIWIFSKKYRAYDGSIAIRIEDFLVQIPEYSTRIDLARQYAACSLRISVVSTWAQCAFSVDPNELEVVRRLNIPLEVSVFSWGNCKNE